MVVSCAELSITTGVGVPGEVGLNVTSSPAPTSPSIAVHWLVEGQAMSTRSAEAALSIVIGVGLPGDVGLKVTS
jgi:hypothetical protein